MFVLCVADGMVPIKEEEILFLSDTDPLLNWRKGVTVSSLEQRNEVRVSIWTFIKKGADGYITPRKGGISLSTREFETLSANLPWVSTQVRLKGQESVHRFIEGLESVEDINLLKRKLENAEKNLAGPSRPTKQIKRRGVSAAQGAP